ncbi:hypothetical protein UXO05_02775 [Enterobacter ludwigii]|uniref:hypothetical protein n=1 Tax=Enterobacter ludwigii TaxID=299767 RepID=UPI002FCEB36A
MINRAKLEHILEYAKQQRHIGLHCKVPAEDMVKIVEMAMLQGADASLTNEGNITDNAEMITDKIADDGNSPFVSDGWVLVPVEPTAEMQSAAASAIRFDTTPINKLWTGNAVYKAMLSAAPQQEVKP